MKTPSFVNELTGEVLKLLNPYESLSNKLKVYHNEIRGEGPSLKVDKKVHLFGLGKAASFQVAALLKLLNESELKEKVGLCVSYTKRDHRVDQEGIIELEGDHPLMSEANLKETDEFINYLQKVPEDESLVFLLSGGASALLERPKEGMSFDALRDAHKELLHSGLGINDMNKKRKELSLVKGGGLRKFIKTKNILQLITCDIPNEKLDDVGSGPLLSGVNDPESVLIQSASVLLKELKKRHSSYQLGKIYDCPLEEMQEDLICEIPEGDFIHVSAGEATIVVKRSNGRGGRNTHFVLSMAERIYQVETYKDIQIMSLGTDGSDGNAPCAGAYLNYDLWKSLDAKPYLKDFNSYDYFKKLGTLIETGPTQTNVMDLRVLWRG